MGGSIGGSLGDAAKNVQRQNEARNRNARQYKREKVDEQTRAAQSNIGEASSDAMSSFEMGMEGAQEFVERNTRSLMPQDSGDDQGSSSAEANYSSSSSGSKSGGQGGKKKGDLKQKKNKQNLSKRSLIKKKQ